jgi:hypothetical protein
MWDARLRGAIWDAREMKLGRMMVMLRWYMLLMILPLMSGLPFLESVMELCPRVEITLALLSWTPLIKFVRAVGICRTFVGRMVQVVVL